MRCLSESRFREQDFFVVTVGGPKNITGYPYGPAFNVVG